VSCYQSDFFLFSSPLKVQIWDADTYLDSADYGPDALINLEDIISHVARMDVTIRGQPYWATIPTGKVRISADSSTTVRSWPSQ
jgi:hypothetical protein